MKAHICGLQSKSQYRYAACHHQLGDAHPPPPTLTLLRGGDIQTLSPVDLETHDQSLSITVTKPTPLGWW